MGAYVGTILSAVAAVAALYIMLKYNSGADNVAKHFTGDLGRITSTVGA